MRAFLWCGALLVTASCFVDDVSESTAGTGAPTSNGGAATSGGAGGEGPGPGPGPGAGGSGGGSVGGSGGSGAGSGAGGSGGAAGSGGSGGAGGAGGCTNHYLSFDDDYAYIAYDQSFDYSNDFSFGGRVRLGADPKFALQGDARSVIFGRSENLDKGYGLIVVEQNGDGLQRFGGVVAINGAPCVLVDPVPVAAGAWRDVRVFFKKAGGATHHLFVEVEGNSSVSRQCADVDTPTFQGQLEFGGQGADSFMGDLDNVFLRKHEDGPHDCSNQDTDAFFTFENDFDPAMGLVDSCNLLTMSMDNNPPAVDCE